MSKQLFTRLSTASLVLVGFASTVFAVPTLMVYQNDPAHCDDLLIPMQVDEIGDLLIFPPDESLEHIALGPSPVIPCPQFNNSALPDELVQMINFTGRPLADVWYVANPETSISNFDGYANDAAFPITAANRGQEAFRIDRPVSDPNGAHHPLVFESLTQDGVWEPFEIWHFVLQDYANSLGIAADQLISIGVGDASSFIAGTPPSSGSIIALPLVPEPSTWLMLVIGLTTTFLRRR